MSLLQRNNASLYEFLEKKKKIATNEYKAFQNDENETVKLSKKIKKIKKAPKKDNLRINNFQKTQSIFYSRKTEEVNEENVLSFTTNKDNRKNQSKNNNDSEEEDFFFVVESPLRESTQLYSKSFFFLQQENELDLNSQFYFNSSNIETFPIQNNSLPMHFSSSVIHPFISNEIKYFEKKSHFVTYFDINDKDYFRMLLNDEFFAVVLREIKNSQPFDSNLNQKNRIGFKELWKFFGLILFSQVVELDSIDDFWRPNSPILTQFRIKNMLQKQDFLTILGNIVRLNSRMHRNWILDMINTKNKRNYIPSSNLVLHDQKINTESSTTTNCYFLIDSENDYIFYSKFFDTQPLKYEIAKSSFCQITFQKFVYFNENFDREIIESYSCFHDKVYICAFSQQQVPFENNIFDDSNQKNTFLTTNFPSIVIDKICKTDDKLSELNKFLEEKLECTEKIKKINLSSKKKQIFKGLSNILFSLEIAVWNSYVMHQITCKKNGMISQKFNKFRLEIIQNLIGE